ncbi:MAG: heme peroxidase family protein [Nocardioides sp.]
MGQGHHGSETFFIEGEGVLGHQVGGRHGNAADPVNDAPDAAGPAPARLAARAAPPFRFSRVGPKGTPLGPALTRKVAIAMMGGGGGSGDVPAGYTYLGQFVDHDLTFDRTDVVLGEDITPAELVQGRSPRLDLDSLYGTGPANPGSTQFYAPDGLHLEVGDTKRIGPDTKKTGHDLPRIDGSRTALIPDPRNDENLIVAQTHVAMIRLHNAVVDALSSVPAAQRFRQARKKVTLHYQWMLRHDYLPRIVDPAVVDDVFTNGRVLVEPDPEPTAVPTMPIEFSIAAFRLGHSMVRSAYNWNRRFPGQAGALEYMFDFSGLGGQLGGEVRLLSNWLADWRRMYDFTAGGHPELAPPGNNVNLAKRIDTLLVDPLKNLPPSTFGGGAGIPFDDVRRNLAFRNLTRAKMVKLATGQQLAQKLTNLGVAVTPLTRNEILAGNDGAVLVGLDAGQKDAVVDRTPLWFYVLREAELNGGRLAGVGARLVAETIHRAMEGSRFSIVRSPGFVPDLGRGPTFEMTDLLLFAFGNQQSGLNPLGGA